MLVYLIIIKKNKYFLNYYIQNKDNYIVESEQKYMMMIEIALPHLLAYVIEISFNLSFGFPSYGATNKEVKAYALLY